MNLDPVLLSRIQFAFVITFHIIFPAFTIGLAAWLATLEGTRLATGNPVYRRVFDFWLRVFALSFGMGVVTGIVMAFQFGTNWSVLAERTGPIQGPLLGYEGFTAFMLEATFFGVMLLGRDRAPPWFYFLACCMVSLGTMLSSFWILANNSWMQVPLGHAIVNGKYVPIDWWSIVTGPIVRVRWPHMLLAAFLTTGMSVIATGAWYLLRGRRPAEARVMLHWGLGLVAVIIPVQMFFGHVTGLYVLQYQPAKFAAIEARWKTQQPASEVLIAVPDPWAERNLFAIEVPKLGSFIASGTWDAKEIGLEAYPKEDQPPVDIPFFAFRIMVGMGLIMVAVSWFGVWLRWRRKLDDARWFLWVAFLSFPSGFVAVLCGWFTAEVGRQPWVVYGLMRTRDAVTPSLTGGDVMFSLLAYVGVYAVIYYSAFISSTDCCVTDRLRQRKGQATPHSLGCLPLRCRPRLKLENDFHGTVSACTLLGRRHRGRNCSLRRTRRLRSRGRNSVGTTRNPTLRNEMMNSISPFWDGNETWLVIVCASLFAAFPTVYAVFLPAFYIPVLLLLFGLIFRGVAFEYRYRHVGRGLWDWSFFLGSTMAAFVQGAAVGAMIRGIPVENGQYVGGRFEWLAPLPVLTGIELVLGYALLGAGWLVLKTTGELHEWAWPRVPRLAAAVLVVLALAAMTSIVERDRAIGQLFLGRGWGLVFPAFALLAMLGIFTGARRRRDAWPFLMTVLFFAASFATLAVMFWP